MIIYLYGPDSYRRQKKVRELARAFQEKNKNADIFEIDLEDDEHAWRRASDFLAQPSMFATTKLLIVRNGGSVIEKGWVAALTEHLTTPTIFILISDEKEPKKALSFLLAKSEKQQQFGELTGKLLEVFIRREAQNNNVVFSSEGLRAFCETVEQLPERGWRVSNEIEKFSLMSKEKPIGANDVYKHIPFVPNRAMYSLVRDITFGKTAGIRLSSLEEAFLRGSAPAYVFNSLVYQLQGEKLLIGAAFDVAIKSGALEYEEALTGIGLA